MQKKAQARLGSIFLVLSMLLNLLPITAIASPLGGTVERVQDTETWYSDATKAFDTRETYWNDQVTKAPEDYLVDVSAQTVSIGSAEALVWWAKQVNGGTSFAGYTVNITADLDLSAHYWTPICTGTVSYSDDGKFSIANNETLEGTTINGNGHKITGLATQTGVRGPNQDSQPGDGQNCYYDAAFIGYSSCNITIEDLTFDGARIAISEPFNEVVNTYGSSMLAVVVGAQSGGSLTLSDVTVNDADVLAMQKASAFVGNLMGNSTLTVEQCAITNSRFSAYFMVAPIASYGKVEQVNVNGIELENNTVRVVEQSGSTYTYDEETGAEYWEGDLNACATALFNDGSSAAGKGTVWTPAAEVNGYLYDTLAAAVEAAVSSSDKTGTVTLLKDTEVSDPITINQGETLTLDMQGHTVTVSPDFSTRLFTNYGDLTIKGNGTVDVTAAGANGYGTVNNYGTLTVEGGIYTNPKESNASNFYNRNGGTATFENATINGGGGCIATQENTTTTINGGHYEDSTYPAIENRGNMLITGGTFINTSCSSCDGSKWGYTVRSGESSETAYLKIQGESEDSVKVTGVQGGLAVIGGTADIYNGIYETVACKIHGGNNAFYAGYFTGESYKTATTIYGGSFTSCSKTAVLVGNGNPAPDSGAGLESTVMIKGGTFVGGDAAKTAITVNKTEYAIGAASISGGTFSSDPKDFLATGYVAKENEDLWTVEASDGMVAKVEKPENGTVSAEVGGNYTGNESEDAGNNVEAGSTVAIDVTTESSDPITAAQVTIDENALNSVQKNNAVSEVTIKTDVGTVTLDKAAWSSITNNAKGNVTLTVKDNTTSWSITATDAAGDSVFSSDNDRSGEITISVPYNAGALEDDQKVVVYYVNEQGDLEAMETTYQNQMLTWATDHLSDYVPIVIDADDIAVWVDKAGLGHAGMLADAIEGSNKVKTGGTIKIIKDTEAEGLAVPSGSNFVLDFDGHIYTLNRPGAGSSNTETNGFQLLKDSTITFKNGTIRISEKNLSAGAGKPIMRIIQNYADLTLENMQIYAKNQAGGEDYALSFNNGNVTFKGTTSVITSSSSNVAFDVCKFSNYPGATVTFDESYTGTVNGQIVYDSTEADTHKLTIEGNGTFGTITAAGSATGAAKNGITISGGHFAQPVNPDYLHESLNTQLKSASNPEAPYSYYTSMDDAIADAKPGDVVTPIQTTPETNTYTVTLNYNDGQTATQSYTEVKNSVIFLPTPTRSGYNFLGWYDGNTKVNSPYKVTGNVTLVAQWSYIDQGGGTTEPSGDYLITVDRTTGGKVTVTPGRADKGDTVTITVKPNDGYVLDELTVTAKDGSSVKLTWKDDNKYTFTMPGSQVSIQATFVKEDGQTVDLPFTDVTESDWYYNAVQFVYENGLMNGTSATTFAPNTSMSRAMIWTVLAAYEGKNTSGGATWYEAGQKWAMDNGISDGTNPNGAITREQLAVMLWRYAGSPETTKSLNSYVDASSVSDWAVEALAWAVDNGIISGMGNDSLAPQGNATRAQVATIMMQFVKNI